MFTKIDDGKVHNYWKCTDEECEVDSIRKMACVTPDWYEHNGTPVCECGCDMSYSHTEIDL